MSDYPQSPSLNPYWCYDPYGYTPNVSLPFNANLSVNTSQHPSFELYNNLSQNGHYGDSGYLSRTPTPPTPARQSSPAPAPVPVTVPLRTETSPANDSEARENEKLSADNKPRLPYVKRTRIQYTMQQLQILEEAFQNNHYPEVTTVDALADLLDVRHEKISIWFQNRRSRFKRQQKPKNASSTSVSASVPSASTIAMTKKPTHSVPMPSAIPSPTYDTTTSYYPPYFWPSPIVDDRSTPSYATHHHHQHHLNSSFYDSYSTPSTPSMWNPNTTGTYPSPITWQRSMESAPKMTNISQ